MTSLPPMLYTEAIKRLGVDPKIADVQKAIDSFVNSDIPLKEPPVSYELNETQHIQFKEAVSRTLSSNDGVAYIRQTAKIATDSLKKTDTMFLSLSHRLTSIDAQFTSVSAGAFAPGLVKIQKDWQSAVVKSRFLAMDISSYASRFASLIIPLIDDKSKDIQFKKDKLQEFIDKSASFVESSANLKADYNAILDDFTSFQARFSSWASEKSDELKSKACTCQGQLDTLKVRLSKTRVVLIGLASGTVAALPITGVAAACAGPAAPAVTVIGLVAAGLLDVAATVLAVQANRLSNEITTKQKEINSVNSQIEAIDKTRKELVQLGTADMLILQESIQSLNNFWSYTAGDARKIQNKLVNMKGDFVSTLL
jgi:hypothetical protein